MNFDEYKRAFYADPQPKSRYSFRGIHGASVHYQDYAAALLFLENIFGPPAYKEGEFTHGWKMGDTWLTAFPSKKGSAANMEIPIYLNNAADVDKLYQAFIESGSNGEAPADTLMYVPVRIAFVTDPFGVAWMLVCEQTSD
jgi:hypothetical protein